MFVYKLMLTVRWQTEEHSMVDTTASQPEPVAAGALKVEITPAMIEAGTLVLASVDMTFAGPELWAERVYRAMRMASASDA